MNEQGGEDKDTAQLFDVLTLLCTQKRTGRLVIGEQEREGEVFITDGKITHAQFKQCVGLQALLCMLAWEEGTYNFTPKLTIDQTTIEMETAELLSRLAQRMQEWHRINMDHPLNFKAILCLLPEASGTIRLKKEEWDILARIDGRKSLQEIADELYMPPPDLAKTIYRFREAGLIGEGTRYPETAYAAFGEEFLSALERELDLVVGPIAPTLLAEVLQDLEDAAAPLTQYRKVDILLKKLSTAIPLKGNKARFKKAFLRMAQTLTSGEGGAPESEDQELNKGKKKVKEGTLEVP
jgi:hypothetical protein